ncbi:kinesin-like protein KIN-4C [Quillaja saponaria]|uniref:Kinesin-like protein KIN-4C n=1 Tax=Quillaja saponaria TaxID=32244 RepID=A0AAD7PSH5_QUISA|nr:kinesin-like protein KIN-4C [Quillaja saponaria]
MMKKMTRRSKQPSPVDASASVSVAVNDKQKYEERIRELEQQNKAFQKEIEELRHKVGNDTSDSNNGLEKLKEDYLGKLNVLEDQVTILKKKLDSQSQFSTHRRRGDEATRQLQFDIQNLKAHKVQLQCKIKLESVQFRLCKASMEKENLQLKKEERRYQYEIRNLLAVNQTLRMVLQRKTEEASMATKRLKDMLESRKSIWHRSAGARNDNIRRIQDTEHELEVTTRLNDLCSEYESQMEEMSEEIRKLQVEVEMLKQEKLRCPSQQKDFDCLVHLDVKDLKEQVNSLSSMFNELQLQKEKLAYKDKLQQDPGEPSARVGSIEKLLEEMDTPETDHFESTKVTREKTALGLCCSCSKKSSCKTNKCQCRSTGGSCGTSCGCTPSKCTNREEIPVKVNESESEMTGFFVNSSASDESKNGSTIASQGAKLLQSALVEKPVNFNDHLVLTKKPLSDIQNTMVKLDAPKPGKKKKPQIPEIQLIRVDSGSSLPGDSNSSNEVDESEAQLIKPVKIPRAAKSVVAIDIPRKESNSDQPKESAISEATGIPNPRNPSRRGQK